MAKVWVLHVCLNASTTPLSYLHSFPLSRCPHKHTHTHTHTQMQWPCRLYQALWMKKRSHLSDSSSLHLAAPFKNTLYSLLKLHLSDSMMESPILPSLSLSPSLWSFSSCLSILAANGSCRKSKSLASLTVKESVSLCACELTCVCVCVRDLGVFWHGSLSISVCMFNRKKRCHNKMCKKVQGRVWWARSCMEVRTGVPGAAGRPGMSELIRI